MTWTGAHHTFVGDLVATVSIGGISVDLIRRPTNGGGGNSRNLNGTYTFDDDATASFNSLPLPATEYPAGSYLSQGDLNAFNAAATTAAIWRLTIQDFFIGDVGAIDGGWTLSITVSNTAPILSGLDTPVIFDENTINATPQIIDADITFADLENNFDGGTLTVTGLLAEDTVAIRNQGAGAGEIGVSGTDVTFEGAVIGNFAGGAGGTFTVTFNDAATAAAIEALIENLTYADSSDAPTASRNLEIKVSDNAGFGRHRGDHDG